MSLEETKRLINDGSCDEREGGDASIKANDKIELDNYEEALTRIGFGRFHLLVLLILGIANASDAVEILCVSFILPAAECDLNLTSSQKGYLSACLFLGMMLGGYTWGSISDVYGRKYILISSLTFNAVFATLCGFSPSFYYLIVFRFLSGFGVGGSIPIALSYFAEFMPKNIRGRMLCCCVSSWLVGNLLVVLIAYLVLGKAHFEWAFIGSLKINNWRFFMILCALPSTVSVILIMFLPESPKFTLYSSDHEQTRRVLQYMYMFNNRVNTPSEEDTKLEAFKFFEKLKNSNADRENKRQNTRTRFESIKHNTRNILKQTLLLFQAPYTGNTIILLVVMFALMFGYYGLWMWLPELFERMKQFGGTPCRPAHTNTSIIHNRTCIIDNSVFVSSLFGALSNMPGNVLTIIYIDRFGRNLITVGSLIIAGISVLGISFVTTTTQGVILITIFGGITTFTFNSFACTSTELYPTTLRSTALGVQYVTGRSGAILGNLLFGLAVDIKCYIPLAAISFIMVFSGLLALKLPESNKKDIH